MTYALSSVIKRGKDVLSPCDQTNVVYKISCRNCPASYVGQTKRCLGTRIAEHRRASTKPQLDTPIFKHILETDHSFNFEKPEVLDIEVNYFRRTTSEMIHINAQTSGVNIKEDFEKLNSAYTPLFLYFKNKSNINR